MSTLFLRTLRDDPADAEVPSHKLLVRAGYVRRSSPGVYEWLPLGLKVFRNVERIVRDEMDAIGAQEILLPALLPREPYEATGRWTEYGPTLFRMRDRKGADMLLGPTHEEMFTRLVKGEYSSYKDLPVTLYQVQTKYRDEERPRAGLLRGREFVMKDSYSFDLDDAGLQASYDDHRAAYQRIFERLGITYVIVAATAGAMGGSRSEEFLAVCDVGEDTFVRSTESDYAANVEAVETPVPEDRPLDGLPAATVRETGDTPTIETLVEWANRTLEGDYTAADTLKNVMVKIRRPGGEWQITAVAVPGDREVDMKRLEAAVEPAEVDLLEDSDFAANPSLVKGYIGPKAVQAAGFTYLVDPRVVTGTRWITGADEQGKHYVDLVCGRDFTPDGVIEAAQVRAGDPSPDGRGVLETAKGIEIGHIFQLGRKYTDAFSFDVLGENGKPVRPTMGSYGLGVSRAVAVLAEQMHDEVGLRWPREVAPYDVHLVVANKDEQAVLGAEQLAEQLDVAGLSVLFDDRKASPGVKFKDAELLGMPVVVVVGRGWADGTIEIRDRFTGSAETAPIADAVQAVTTAVRG
ncbi:proline--tRNA ligase [Gordonia shandongensis]|uniref:proline--tRNA ligase n=1 Tax=Gordonia shandongensis TaxID=376351 RepID=UPI00042680DB|nr:proline--tRNA ligase [Gordonia shandongensis]